MRVGFLLVLLFVAALTMAIPAWSAFIKALDSC